MLRRRPSPALVVACLALMASLSGAALAAIPAKDGDVHACYSRSTGAIQLVNTQSDNFDCEHNWRGLIWDTKPTELVSPNGDYRVSVTNDGVRMTSPGGGVELTANKVTVRGTSDVDVKAAGKLTLKGADVQTQDGTP
jgi:hypothetical protein